MGKRKVKKTVELRQSKRRKDEDSKLSEGLFNNYGTDAEIDEPQMSESESETEQNEEDEQDYELRPRSFQNTEEDVVEGLPIRGPDGKIQRVMRKQEAKKVQPESESEQEDEEEKQQENQADQENDSEDSGEEGLTPEEKIVKTKEEIATIAEKLLEDSEANVLLLARLRRMANSRNPNTAKLSLLALVPIFKSIAPSYRIRALTDVEKKEKVSRDVAKLRYFEEHLVLEYKQYIDYLARKSLVVSTSPKASELDIQLGLLATNAACELATALRFFNYRKNVFQILVKRVTRKPSNEAEFEIFKKTVQTLEELLGEDSSHGDISLDLSFLLKKSLKVRDFKVDESVLNIFLSLSILSDYDPNASEERKEEQRKLRKQDRVHRSKKEKKQMKERKIIEKELRSAEQAVTAEEREKNQAQVLKLLITLYLEILRARPEQLMAPVLEGLAKFGHQVNVDLIGDFLQVLREICQDLLQEVDEEAYLSTTHIRQILLSIVTAFALTANLPPKKVAVDLNKFVQYLYTLLSVLPQDVDIEFSHKTLRLLDPLSKEANFKPNVSVSTKAELLLRALDSIFFNSRSGSRLRSLAFTKRLYAGLLQFPEKSSIATLKLLDKLMGRYEEVKGLYTTEDRVQNGVYHPEVDDIERANAEVAVLWENVLLEKHYSPTVATGARALFKKAK